MPKEKLWQRPRVRFFLDIPFHRTTASSRRRARVRSSSSLSKRQRARRLSTSPLDSLHLAQRIRMWRACDRMPRGEH